MENIYFSFFATVSFLIALEEIEKSKTDQDVHDIINSGLDRSALYGLKRSSENRLKALNNIEGLPDR